MGVNSRPLGFGECRERQNALSNASNEVEKLHGWRIVLVDGLESRLDVKSIGSNDGNRLRALLSLGATFRHWKRYKTGRAKV